MINVDNINPNDIYKDIYSLVSTLPLENSKVGDVHSIDVDKTSDGRLNISFEYDNDYVAYISIDNDGIKIDAPYKLANYIKSKISSKFPDYTGLFID